LTASTRHAILTDQLIGQIAGSPDDWVILENHPDFPGYWLAESLNPSFLYEFYDIVGSYRAVAPAKLEAFLERAEDYGYSVAFGEDPAIILDRYERLNETPEFSINSELPGTVNGFLPYQLQGYNFLKDLDGGVAMWSTGTGKTVLASAILRHHILKGSFDIAWVVVKAHNKVNTQRTFSRLANVDSFVVDGERKKRHSLYAEFAQSNDPVVAITNYEKFRVDQDELLPLFEKRILVIWDEMPTKLKSRGTALYKSVRKCLYTSTHPNWEKKRPASLRQFMLSATPIENSPEDFFSCVRLLDPRVFGSVAEFRNQFVASYNYFRQTQPETWHNLDRMGLMASSVTHRVNKSDPDIAKQFPEVVKEPYFIDWDRKDRKIYDELAKEMRRKIEDREVFDTDQVLSMIGVMQMLCDAPSMVADSAARREVFEQAWEYYTEQAVNGAKAPVKDGSLTALKLFEWLGEDLTNDRHTKIDTLRSLLTEVHPDEKFLVFSSFGNALLPILEGKLREWNVPFVSYSGNGKERQEAEDRFKNDPKIRVFLSSDRGSDSLNLEAASVVVHYDLPWKWSTLTQRENRVHRVTSGFGTVRYYTLMMANSIEDRKLDIIKRKQAYHEQVFDGAISDQALSTRMSMEDLLYILGA
jgi:SNF2 family DNA or RNA helicase